MVPATDPSQWDKSKPPPVIDALQLTALSDDESLSSLEKDELGQVIFSCVESRGEIFSFHLTDCQLLLPLHAGTHLLRAERSCQSRIFTAGRAQTIKIFILIATTVLHFYQRKPIKTNQFSDGAKVTDSNHIKMIKSSWLVPL